MTTTNPKMHIICGSCGCNTMLEYSGSTLYCRNCSTFAELQEILPERTTDKTYGKTSLKELGTLNEITKNDDQLPTWPEPRTIKEGQCK